jgi:hypothetical protein
MCAVTEGVSERSPDVYRMCQHRPYENTNNLNQRTAGQDQVPSDYFKFNTLQKERKAICADGLLYAGF